MVCVLNEADECNVLAGFGGVLHRFWVDLNSQNLHRNGVERKLIGMPCNKCIIGRILRVGGAGRNDSPTGGPKSAAL
jgi:hypothetical protein